MLKIVLLIALGFFAAMLLTLMLAPLLWRRAVRLTTRRIQGTAPLSMSDIQADKDQLRAEFAMSTRKLEMNVDELKRRATSQLMDISKQSGKVRTLSFELQDQLDIVSEHETTIKTLKERLLRSEDEAKGYLKSYKDANLKISQLNEQYEQKVNVVNAVSMKADERKVEIAALKTRFSGKEQELQTLQTQYESQMVSMTEDRENLATGINDLQASNTSHEKELSELRARDEKQKSEIERLTAEIATAEEARITAVDDSGKLRADLNLVRNETENGWEEERLENAMLRERLNDVAAEVATMTAALEGDDNVIENILADIPDPATTGDPDQQSDKGRAVNGKQANGKSNMEPSSLAARIRALQSAASRA